MEAVLHRLGTISAEDGVPALLEVEHRDEVRAEAPQGRGDDEEAGRPSGAPFAICKLQNCKLQNFAIFGGLVLGRIKTKFCKKISV